MGFHGPPRITLKRIGSSILPPGKCLEAGQMPQAVAEGFAPDEIFTPAPFMTVAEGPLHPR